MTQTATHLQGFAAPLDFIVVPQICKTRTEEGREASDAPAASEASTASADAARQAIDQTAIALRRELGDDRFSVDVAGPLVVIGDEGAAVVKRRTQGTVRWAYQQLIDLYFDKRPTEAVQIWICRDEASYRQVARDRFRTQPNTPFGFYLPQHAAIVVNGATGSGTIVHEMVHSLIAIDFPSCPPWFNEGLASLYEQCEEKNGQIWGRPNWRLRGLLRATDAGRLFTLEELCQRGMEADFLEAHPAAYAQARYLCLYLQERGKLTAFYRRFRAASAQDPTGYKTLDEILGHPPAWEFQRDWTQFIRSLTLADGIERH